MHDLDSQIISHKLSVTVSKQHISTLYIIMQENNVQP